MTKTILNRAQVDMETTWDLTSIYASESAFEAAITTLIDTVDRFKDTYQGTLTEGSIIHKCIKDYEEIHKQIQHIFNYASLKSSEDSTNPENQNRSSSTMMKVSSVFPKLNFVEEEIRVLDEAVLKDIIQSDPDYAVYFSRVLRKKPHTPSEDVVNALSILRNTFQGPYDTYEMNKHVDMDFGSFEAKGQTYPNSFGMFEDEWETDNDTTVRHTAFDAFYGTLAKHQNTVASVYATHVQTEKALGQISKFDNTIDSLLFEQEVTRDMYDRQIDLIMTHLAPHMRKYAKLLKRVHKLDKMTYKDLKLVVDPAFEPSITIEESKTYLDGALERFGSDYLDIVHRAFDERWIDFPQNKGKSTGAFCAVPYGIHPYVLISWTEKMNEVFVLAHELGHAGHFYLAGENQTLLNAEPSLYLIEAPSTMNELMMVDHLMNTVDDKRMKRWVLSTIIARTYYHNFVTHLLEAAYQREVYHRVDNNQPITAHSLNAIKRNVLETFWGDDVEISELSELTWMRQPHYYMGLYPYTYSAGLTLATVANRKISNQELSIDQWLDFLKAGGTKNPIDLAKMVDVDLTTEQPLMQTIDYIGSIIDEIITLTDELESESN